MRECRTVAFAFGDVAGTARETGCAGARRHTRYCHDSSGRIRFYGQLPTSPSRSPNSLSGRLRAGRGFDPTLCPFAYSGLRKANDIAKSAAPTAMIQAPSLTSAPLHAIQGKTLVTALGLVTGMGMNVSPTKSNPSPVYLKAPFI